VKRPTASTTQWIATAACAVIAAGSLGVSVVFVLDDRSDDKQTDATIQQIIDQRTESRGATCAVLRTFAVAHNAKVVADAMKDNEFIVLLATSAGRKDVTPENQRIVDAEIAENNRLRDENIVPVPDCSTPEGITALFEKADT
jgi:hypothetical protein